jgi:uncharacterized protein (DUF885 family)
VNERLDRIGAEYWEHELEREPTTALLLGDHRFDDRFEDGSRAGEDAAIASLRRFAADAAAIEPGELTADDEAARDLLCFEASTTADALETRQAQLAVNHAIGIQTQVPVAFQQIPLLEPAHAAAMVAKFGELGRGIRQLADRLVEGVEAGRTPPRLACDRTVEQLDALLVSEVAGDPLLEIPPPPAMSEDEVASWRSQLADVITREVRPAWAEYRRVIAEEVAPAARPDDQPGLSWLDDGEATYRRLLHRHTSTDLTAQQIHDIGLGQIAKLADEYRELGAEVLGTDDLDEIFTRLRSDDELLFEDGPTIVAASERAMAKARAAMGDWFGRLPKADCLVRETPVGPLAFYYPPAADGSRPGTFFVNTSDPTAWHRYEIEAMAYHEGIPGHHLQIAIAGELDGVAEFRKHLHINAYVEGWGLYTERLADEMGLYAGPLERIGMLSADSMRASRLVLDTGLHAMGWSRQQAIDYFAANSPMSLGLIEAEVDRYVGMPGQACGYMIGRLEILRMRAEAMETMGDRFDIKGFHDTVLGSGSVPLATLDRLVRSWAAA